MSNGPDGTTAAPARWRAAAWGFCAVLLIALTAVLAAMQGFGSPAGALWWGLPPYSWVLIAAGATYLSAVVVAPRGAPTARSVELVILAAVAMRVPLWTVPPAPGADSQRYLWDGALVANGVSPYRHSPQAVMSGEADDPAVERLASQSGGLPGRIRRGQLRTSHLPVAQGLFATAYWIGPFSPTGWRVVLAGCEIAAALALLSILRRARMPAVHLAVLLWNPILVTETYLGGHLDVAAGAMVLVALALLCRGWFIPAGGVMALAAGVKPWPILLLPLILAPLWGRWRRFAAAGAVTAGVVALLAGLYLPAAGGPDSGLRATSAEWRNNAGAFALGHAMARTAPSWLTAGIDPYLLAHAATAVALAAVALWQGRRAGIDPRQVGRRAGLVVVVMLLMSATLYPWHYAAAVPIAALAPAPALLAWTVLLPACTWEATGLAEPARLAILHGPVWVLLLGGALWRRRGTSGDRRRGPDSTGSS